jgi:Rod binding domain-containing protein
MQVDPFSRSIKPEDIPIERLAGNSQVSEADKIAGVSRQFEAVLLRQFLTEAQKPLLNPKDDSNGAVKDIYKDMMVNHLADEISKKGNFGLAKFFQAQMTQHQPKKIADESSTSPQ